MRISYRVRQTASVLAAIVALLLLPTGFAKTAAAAPDNAARDLAVGAMTCAADGVQTTFTWTPSYAAGVQWLDISESPAFDGWGNDGPLPASADQSIWMLKSDTAYYVRVATIPPVSPPNFTHELVIASDTLAFRTLSCGAFEPPHDVSARLKETSQANWIDVSWQRGTGNLLYCIDTAFSQADLLTIQGSWHNWGCGNTETSIELHELACERMHYFRVWAAGASASGYSEVGTFESPPCVFTSPFGLVASFAGADGAEFTWHSGRDNQYSCVDLATNQTDLTELNGTWFNTGCGHATQSAPATGLDCETLYYWRVWAAGTKTSGYSPTETFRTPGC